MLTRPILTLKVQSKFKSDITKRFAAYDFLKVDCTLETSRTNESDTPKRFEASDFLKIDWTLETPKTINNRDTGTLL